MGLIILSYPQESRDTTHLQNDPEKTWATVLDTLETKQSTMAQCGRYYLLSEPTQKLPVLLKA